jgi:hypothetical protein
MDWTFGLLCMGLIALLFGSAVVFFGYRLFLFLLPVWGFFVGFFLGAQTLELLLGGGFLGSITGWVVGFFVGLLFALLSYLFYVFAVAVISFSLGYGLIAGILGPLGLVTWLIAVVVGIVVAGLVLRFNVQKYAIIVATAVGGTAGIIYTILAMTVPGFKVLDALGSPVKMALDSSWLWVLFFVVVAGAGIVGQIRSNRAFEIDSYNRMEEWA